MSTTTINRRRHRKARGTRALMAVALAAAALAVTAARAEAAGTVHGCPSGYVCIYPQNSGWNGDRPALRYYTYGAHNLSNQFGTHRMLNNQFGGAWTTLCTGYNATGDTAGLLGPGYSYDFNLTPVNSIKLTAKLQFDCY